MQEPSHFVKQAQWGRAPTASLPDQSAVKYHRLKPTPETGFFLLCFQVSLWDSQLITSNHPIIKIGFLAVIMTIQPMYLSRQA